MNWLNKLDDTLTRLIHEEEKERRESESNQLNDDIQMVDCSTMLEGFSSADHIDEDEGQSDHQVKEDEVGSFVQDVAPSSSSSSLPIAIESSLLRLELTQLSNTPHSSKNALHEQLTGDVTTEQRPQTDSIAISSQSLSVATNKDQLGLSHIQPTVRDNPDDPRIEHDLTNDLKTPRQPITTAKTDPLLLSARTPAIINDVPHDDTPFFQTPMSPQDQSQISSLSPPSTRQSVEQPIRHMTTDEAKRLSLPTVEVQTPPRNISVVQDTDLTVEFPLPVWDSSPTGESVNNCLGVVHVKALAAQKLACPIGSTVQPILALAPWKGRVRGDTAIAFNSQDVVCVQWDALANTCSMVHSYNSSDTPLPTIRLELVFKPIAMLEFSMCTVELTCRPLLQQPGVWKKQWVQATVVSKALQAQSSSQEQDWNPLILLEAAFFPALGEENEAEELEMDMSYTRRAEAGSVQVGDEPASRVAGDASTTATSTYVLKKSNKPHLMKLQSFWVPAQCSVCKQSLIGWKRAYRCEACNVDCCSDCQLQVDLQIPCGSVMAQHAVKSVIQNQLTVQNMLTTIAPVDENYEPKITEKHRQESRNPNVSSMSMHQIDPNDSFDVAPKIQDIAICEFKIQGACVFANPLPVATSQATVFDESNRIDLRQGDYFVRISCPGSPVTHRTNTVQNTGRPRFSDTETMSFGVAHYGMEYRIDVVDAYSNRPVGTACLTVQTLLQLQRDAHIREHGVSAFMPWLGRNAGHTTSKLRMELRTGFKEVSTADYYTQTKTSRSSNKEARRGLITGWIAFDVALEEDTRRLYGRSPIQCPSRPADNFDVDAFQLHISRISSIISDLKRVGDWYFYMMSWEKPLFTASSLVMFLWFCFGLNWDYLASVPVMCLVMTMIHYAQQRMSCRIQDHFIRREKERCIRAELETSSNHQVHRPMGTIYATVLKGRNLKSRELGLPGSVGCRILWHPLRYCTNAEGRKSMESLDRILKSHHDIGDTNYMFTTNPDWERMKASEELIRLRRLTDTAVDSEALTKEIELKGSSSRSFLSFPILQPIRSIKQTKNSSTENGVCLAPWTESMGAIVFQLKFADVINRLPGFEDAIGEVAIPVSKLVTSKEIVGWFQVTDVGTTHVTRCDEHAGEEAPPRIYLHLKFQPPPKMDDEIAEVERETSVAVAEEMIRAAGRNQNVRIDLIGSSVGAFNTVRGLGGTVHSIQNSLGFVADTLEIIRNVIFFVDPHVSSLALCGVITLWVFLALVPMRAIFLVVGTVQYTATFLSKFVFSKTSHTKKEHYQSDVPAKALSGNSIMIWLANALQSIPTDEDLRKVYFWESRRVGEQECSKLTAEKRIARLNRLWRAEWYSTVNIRVQNARRNSMSSKEWHWEHGFAVLLGRQLVIWRSENDFDDGEEPFHKLMLSGHAGLAGLSPLDTRELSKDEIARVSNIFGRGSDDQVKLMLLLPDEPTKESLEDAVVAASFKSD